MASTATSMKGIEQSRESERDEKSGGKLSTTLYYYPLGSKQRINSWLKLLLSFDGSANSFLASSATSRK
jgi:hypothetical protein